MGDYETVEWNKLTEELLNKHLMTQSEIAEKCNVSQKSVSFWLNSVYKPSKYAQRELLKLTEALGINPKSIGNENKSARHTNNNGRILNIYNKLSNEKKKQLLQFALFLEKEE